MRTQLVLLVLLLYSPTGYWSLSLSLSLSFFSCRSLSSCSFIIFGNKKVIKCDCNSLTIEMIAEGFQIPIPMGQVSLASHHCHYFYFYHVDSSFSLFSTHVSLSLSVCLSVVCVQFTVDLSFRFTCSPSTFTVYSGGGCSHIIHSYNSSQLSVNSKLQMFRSSDVISINARVLRVSFYERNTHTPLTPHPLPTYNLPYTLPLNSTQYT